MKVRKEYENNDYMSKIIERRKNEFLQAKINIITWHKQIKEIAKNYNLNLKNVFIK